MVQQQLEKQYEELLRAYLEGRGEDQLYFGQQLSKWFFTHGVAPENVVDLHLQALQQVKELPEFVRDSFQLLMEVMMEYGNAFREFHSLRHKQRQLEQEIEVAATMQQTFLTDWLPSVPQLEVGIISVPAKRMSGDYYNFYQHMNGDFSVAIADIVGKGVPAALCMSMIKYGMDSMTVAQITPRLMLRYLNNAVGKNIDPSMFITMLFGRYEQDKHQFHYSVAGHEPGFIYRAAEDAFYDLEGQGMALGIAEDVTYQEYLIELNPGDMVILLTDGVTERKIGDTFMQREDLIHLIRRKVGSTAQQIVDDLYHRLLQISNFDLPDDYTMLVLRRQP
ncbi:PP2C family protein-serine/threonine phosphatase [Brevibacillus ginsengisoli]|uniref:PP2C family protein-serine/threonine phosphatase n=1 Tax=Brevibacillus ginsengisoli TaxID=363854 RepID=UPI003CF70976